MAQHCLLLSCLENTIPLGVKKVTQQGQKEGVKEAEERGKKEEELGSKKGQKEGKGQMGQSRERSPFLGSVLGL